MPQLVAEASPSDDSTTEQPRQEVADGGSRADPQSGDPEGMDVEAPDAFRSIGSDSRLAILYQLMQGERSVSELSETLRMHPATIRYHLGILLRDGVVEQLPQRLRGSVGRPSARFRLRSDRVIRGFPPRRYEILCEILLDIVHRSLPREEWSKALYSAGRAKGRQVVEVAEEERGIKHWDAETFVEVFLKKVMPDLGICLQILETKEDVVRYRVFACPFQELAIQYPDEICDHLDRGFHEGIDDGLKVRVAHERLACMGHRDPYCEYEVRWTEGF